MSKAIKNARQNARFILEELEPRRLFSGGIEGIVDTGTVNASYPVYLNLDSNSTQSDAHSEVAAETEQQAQEIVFVDAAVNDYQQLVDDLLASTNDDRNFEVVMLERDRDGIEQISTLLQGYDNVDAIHIISHGSDGSIQLGNTSLDADTLQQNSLSIALWANAFTDSGDILIYGCDLAASEVGQNLIDELGALTLTDVAASEDLTGAESKGGDWDLEYRVGDVEADIAVSTQFQANWSYVLAPNTAPSFPSSSFIAHDISTTADGARSVITADLDGDGDLDVITASTIDDTVAWYENDGSENFTINVITSTADNAGSVTVADLDGDGDLDVLSASSLDSTIAWYENDGAANPSFTTNNILTNASGASSVTTADVDGDGDLDLLYSAAILDRIAWLENDGAANPSFSNHNITATADGAAFVSAADLDGDGDLDVVSASRLDDTIAWYENDGSETFTARDITTTADGARYVSIADLDGDGDLDVLSASQYDNTIAWYENDGGAIPTFTARDITTTAMGAYSVTTADMDGDGDLDLVAASQNNNTIAWYENDGGALPTFTAHDITTTLGGAIQAAVADVDGDGDLDVVAAAWGSDTFAWYENDGALNGAPIFVEGGPAVILDADVDVSDAEMDAFNAGNGNYDGASVTLVRNGGVNSDDVFSFVDGNNIFLVGGNTLERNGDVIATFDTTTTPGQLVIDFTQAATEIPTSVDVDNILRQITYANSSATPPASAQIDWTFDDGNSGAQGTGGALQAVGSTTVEMVAILTTGPSVASVGLPFILDLDGSNFGNASITGWTINWGDGTIDNIVGNPSTATHTYTEVGFTYNITASLTDEGGTHFQNNLIVASYISDDVISYLKTTGAFLDTFDATTLDGSYGMVIGPDGMAYASGWGSGSVHKFDPATGADLGVFVNGLSSALGIAFGPDGNLYVADKTDDKILQYDGSTGALLSTFVDTSGEVNGPSSIVFGPNGALYVGGYDSDDVWKYDGATGTLIGPGALVTAGSGYLNSVNGLTFGPDGNLYVSSSGDNEVYRFDPTTGALVAGPSDDAFVRAADNGSLSWATGLSFGPDGNLYVGSYSTDEVLRFDGTTGAYIDVYADTSTGPLDGTEGLAFAPGHQVTVVDFSAPTVANLAGDTLAYTEGDGAQVIEQSDDALVTDADSTDFDTGNLTVSIGLTDWWDSNWTSRTKVTFDNTGSSENLIDFPVLVTITAADFDFSRIEAGGADIRFVDNDGVLLEYEIDSWDDTGETANVWVKVQQVDANSATDYIYVYYENGGASTAENASLVWDTNYAGVWHLDETGDGTAGEFDDSSGTNDGQGGGGTATSTQISDGNVGGGQSFDGTDDYIDLGTMGGFGSNLADATYQFWIKTTETTLSSAMGTINDGAQTAVIIQLNSEDINEDEGFVRAYTRAEGGLHVGSAADMTAFNDGGWHQVTVIAKGPSGVIEHYLDGTYVSGTYAETDSPSSFADFAYSMTLGASNNRGTIDAFANASFDEVRISDTARSADWIEASYRTQQGSFAFNSFGSAETEHLAEDVLSIRNEGTGAGQIGFSAGNLTYEGVLIGTATGGSGADLVVTFNANATPTAVTALVNNVTFEDTDTVTATVGNRTVSFTLDDGDGATSAVYDATVTVSGVPPTFTSLDGAPTFVEGGATVVLDADVDVGDTGLDALNSGNGNYSGADLTLVRNGGVSTQDVFSFNDGNGITLSGGNLIKNSQVIATLDTTTTPGQLVITFTDANGEIPTSADADNIMRQIAYANSSDAPPAHRRPRTGRFPETSTRTTCSRQVTSTSRMWTATAWRRSR